MGHNPLEHAPTTPSKRGKGPRTRKSAQRLARRNEVARLEEEERLRYEYRQTDQATDIRPRYIRKDRLPTGEVATP